MSLEAWLDADAVLLLQIQPLGAQEPLQPSVAQAQPPNGSIESIKVARTLRAFFFSI